MGVKNTRVCQLPLHLEIEALIWAIECMRNLRQYTVTFATDCFQLVKMVSEPEEQPAFASYLEDIKIMQRSFHSLELIYTIYQGRLIQGWVVQHVVQESNSCLQSIWMRSYQFGLQSLYEFVMLLQIKTAKKYVINVFLKLIFSSTEEYTIGLQFLRSIYRTIGHGIKHINPK